VLRSRFLWKLYAGYALLILLAVTTVGFLLGRRITADTRAETEHSLLMQAHLLRDIARPYLRGADDSHLQGRVEALRTFMDTRLTVVRSDGTVLADSDEDPVTMDNHGSRPEILAARVEGSGTATRFSRTIAATMMYVALTVEDDGELMGFVRVSLPLTVIRTKLTALRVAVTLGAMSAAAAALLVGFLLARRVIAPLASMTAVSESIADGNYEKRVASRSNDEIGRLASAFNRMAAELESRLHTITEDRTKLLTILGGMVEGVVAIDGDQKVVHLNSAAGRILEVPPSECIGRPIWEITRARKVGESLERSLLEGKEVSSELRLQGDHQDRVVELRAAPLQSGQGGLVGAVLVLHEVTELRRLETVRQDFVANVSHELKTPITAIRGLIDTVVEDGDMPEATRQRFLQKVKDQAIRLSLLVTDLLTLARLESADGMVDTESMNVCESVEKSINNFRASAEEHGIQLIGDLPPAPVRIIGDVEAVELVVNNLLDNALKYTQEGGRVWVRLDTDGTMVVLEVEDTGIGIAKEHHGRIFERFYRVDKARSRELGGTGLGLSIVKHVCRTLGGSISVESEVGTGSTFRVRFPLGDNCG